MRNPFQPTRGALPRVLPIFPLPGVILLPGAQLPLNIFEPRYLEMTLDALGGGRVIGMVQPDPKAAAPGREPVYRVGGAGRITAFSETDDGRLLIVLTGVCRFEVGDELAECKGYRRVVPKWDRFAVDLEGAEGEGVCPERVLPPVARYLEARGETPDLEALGKLPPVSLVDALCMSLPFPPEEKQVLLEAPTPEERAETLVALVELEAASQDTPDDTWH